MQPQSVAKKKNKRRKRGRVFFKPLNLLSCIYLYSHILALCRQISSIRTALAQWITHPKIHRSTLYYISDCVTSALIIAISNKLIYIFDFFCRYLHVYQTFTIHFSTSPLFSSFFIASSSPPFYLKVHLFFNEPVYKYAGIPI